MKKTISLLMILLFVLLLTGCFGANRSTTVIEHDQTGVPRITGTTKITIEARGDIVRTWEVITYYDLQEYFDVYGYEDADAVRAWFAGPGPRLLTFDGMDFELVDITNTHVITRMFYDYNVISDADRAAIVGEANDFISVSQSVELHEQLGGRVVSE